MFITEDKSGEPSGIRPRRNSRSRLRRQPVVRKRRITSHSAVVHWTNTGLSISCVMVCVLSFCLIPKWLRLTFWRPRWGRPDVQWA